MARVLSGIQPTGDVHIGNYVGAIRQWARDQHTYDSYFCVVDLHALTVPRSAEETRTKTLEVAQILLAAGLDPDRCTLFIQSHVPEHAELCWMLNCVATFGELRRMTQFKVRSKVDPSVTVGLLDYPVLQAADILLYDAERVPVGADQRQHLELCRDIAIRFNRRYGETFVVPEAAIPRSGGLVMDLQDPTRKMSKSMSTPAGMLVLLEKPESMLRKIRRAVTDSETEVRYDPAKKPGVSNLVELLAVATDRTPKAAAESCSSYGDLKEQTAAALAEFVRPLHERYREVQGDPAWVQTVLQDGAEKARAFAAGTLTRARDAMGLVPRHWLAP